VCYFLPLGKLRIPAGVLASVASLGIGLGLGVLMMGMYGYQVKEPTRKVESGEGGERPVPPGRPPMGGMMGMPRGGGRGGAPNPKTQLASLVGKLELLSRKPQLELNDEQRKTIRKQLEGLSDKKELREDDAQKRLEAILDVVKGQKETLAAVGFRWPNAQGGGGGGFQRPATPPANPFTQEANKKELKTLEQRLAEANKET